jgi:hypothetical protein
MTVVGGSLQTIWSIVVIGLGSDPRLTVDGFIILVIGAALLLCLWLARGIAELRVPKAQRSIRWLVAPLLVIALVVLVANRGTFWLRFLISRSALEQFVEARAFDDRSRAADILPATVGLFTIRETEMLPTGDVRVVTCFAMGKCGLLYALDIDPASGPDDYYEHLSGQWWSWYQRW